MYFMKSNALYVNVIRFKSLLFVTLVLLGASGCSTNPATGQQQFTALMSPSQEQQVGANEHSKIMKNYGSIQDKALLNYVRKVGADVAKNTERADVDYKFFVLDDPMVNAFALPGGYVYVTRGLLAQANSEAELAGVLGHEVGHITGRHSAERYSRGVLTSLGAAVLGAALESNAASQALGVGSDLFLKSYSRSQEHEADMLGIRYLNRSGYHPSGMPAFLTALEANTELEMRLNGKGGRMPGWMSTHPLTADRVQQTIAQAKQFPQEGKINRNEYLNQIDGMIYGDSPKQGFVRGNKFYHPEINFTFEAPSNFEIVNQPHQVVSIDKKSGAVIIFDIASIKKSIDPLSYLTQAWMKGAKIKDAEKISVNDRSAATASFKGTVDRRAVTIRLVAVEWAPGVFYRFQMAIPKNAPKALIEDLKRTTYSLRKMTSAEKQSVKPHKVRIITAQPGDTVKSLAARMPFNSLKEERFRALNALIPGQGISSGQKYKLVYD